MTYTQRQSDEWKAESYKKWRATDLAEQCKPWEGAVHQYFVNEIIEPLIHQALAEDRERVVEMIEKQKARCTDVLYTECCKELLSSLPLLTNKKDDE